MRKAAGTTWVILSLFFFFSCSSPQEKYRESAQEYEGAIQRFEQLDLSESYQSDAILFVGSSSIRLWDTIAEDMAPYPVIQRGFGGSRLSDVAWYVRRIIYPHRFRALVLFVANDISGGDSDRTPEEVSGLFEDVVDIVREKYPTTPIFWIAVTPTESRWAAWPQIRSAGELIRQVCSERENLYFIDTSQYYLRPDGRPNPTYFREDKLHLNRDGYRLWSRIIKKHLDRVLN